MGNLKAKGQVPLTAFFHTSGSSQVSSSTTRKNKKRRKSEALGLSPTTSPKKKAKLKQTLASPSTPSRILRSSTKKSRESEIIPDSQEPELGLNDDYPFMRDVGKESTPTLPRSTTQSKEYLPTPPDTHLAPPKRSWREQDRRVVDDRDEGTSSVATRQDQTRSFHVQRTPTRLGGRPLGLTSMSGLPLTSFSVTKSPASTGLTRFVDPGDEVIPSSQTPPTTPKRLRAPQFASPTRIGGLIFTHSPSRLRSSPKSIHDRSCGEVIESSQSQELSNLLSSPGLAVIPTSQADEEELVFSSLPSPRRSLSRLEMSPRRGIPVGLVTPSTVSARASSTLSRLTPQSEHSSSSESSHAQISDVSFTKPSSQDMIIPETQPIPDMSQHSSQSSVRAASNYSRNSSSSGSSAQLPFPSGQFPPSSLSTTNDTQMSDPFSQIDMSQQSWERTPERLKHTGDPNATEPALPSILPALLSVKPQRIETFSQEDVRMHGSDDDSVTESEPSQTLNQTSSGNPSSSLTIVNRVVSGDDSETESETEDEKETSLKQVSTTSTIQQSVTLSANSNVPPTALLTSAPSPSPPLPIMPPPLPPVFPNATTTITSTTVTNVDESQTQPEDDESQISDTPCSIPKDYTFSTQQLNNLFNSEAGREFLEMFTEGAQTPI